MTTTETDQGPILSDAEVKGLEAERDQLSAQVAQIHARIGEIDRAIRASREAQWEVLGKDATATCLRHRRPVCWIPAPGWWIHDDDGPHITTGMGDSRTCSAMWDAKAPIVITRIAPWDQSAATEEGK